MLTFENLYTDAAEIVQDSDATTLILLKRWINIGAKKFGAILNREYRSTKKTFSLVADQQYYQMPEDCIRIKKLVVTVGDVNYPLTLVEDEDTWDVMNMRDDTSAVPTHFFITGSDEFGIFPIPSAAVTDGGTIKYERRMRDMSQANYTTGTITLTASSTAVLGSGTTFTALMVGRYLKADDASGDGMWYRISAFTDATHITLENTYAGSTAASLTYVIGEVPDIPEEYHESPLDYACYRYYLRRKDKTAAADFKALFDEALKDCKAQYSSKSTSQYVRQPKLMRGYIHQQPTQGIQ